MVAEVGERWYLRCFLAIACRESRYHNHLVVVVTVAVVTVAVYQHVIPRRSHYVCVRERERERERETYASCGVSWVRHVDIYGSTMRAD